MGQGQLFSIRHKFRRLRSLGGFFHLLSVAFLVLSALYLIPHYGSKTTFELDEDLKKRQSARQLLLETLDRFARYEKYHHEVYGRYTRDLHRLSLPNQLASGSRIELEQEYEISLLEVQPNRFVLLATGLKNSDRVTIDESHRLNANFVLPPPARAYLFEEADRMLRLQSQGLPLTEGVYGRYWELERAGAQLPWVAVGKKKPVLNERRELVAEREVASIFHSVKEQVQNRLVPGVASVASLGKTKVEVRDVQEWLEKARLAQHVYRREKGAYARRWEDLDQVSDYGFLERMRSASNIRVHPIEVNFGEKGFQLTLEGTEGDLLGERFVVDESGLMRQVRYTETIVQQLQETTEFLESAFRPQIHPNAPSEASPALTPVEVER